MAGSRTQQRRARVRMEIVEVARATLAEQGLPAFALDEVARRLGITKPAIYHYFADKNALIRAAMMEGLLEHAHVLIEAAREAPPGRAVLAILAKAFVDHYAARLSLFRIDFAWTQIHGFSGVREATGGAVLKVMNELTDTVEGKLRAGTRLSSARARRLAVTAWVSALGLVSALSMLENAGTGFAHSTSSMVGELQNLLRGS